MQWPVTVQREKKRKRKGFSPQTQIAQVGDTVVWHNQDRNTGHEPYPQGGNPGDWVALIPGGQPSSDQLDLDVAGTYPYSCSIHSDETGTIIVANPVNIGPSGQENVVFSPASVTITQGQSVSWSNSDSNAHQPAPDGEPDDSWFAQPIQGGEISAAIAFNTAGNLPYHCALHEHETGIIVVQAKTSS